MSNPLRNQTPTQFAREIVGQELSLFVHKRDADGRKYQEPCYELFRPIIDEVLKKSEVSDRRTGQVCEAAVLACVGKLMLASGFTIEYGPQFNADEIVTIKLRDDEPIYRDASVQRHIIEKSAPVAD